MLRQEKAFFENAQKVLIADFALDPNRVVQGSDGPAGRVGSGHDFAGFWQVESGQHFEIISVPAAPFCGSISNEINFYYHFKSFNIQQIWAVMTKGGTGN